MKEMDRGDLEQARDFYRDALRRYNFTNTEQSRADWMVAGRRLSAAVNRYLDME